MTDSSTPFRAAVVAAPMRFTRVTLGVHPSSAEGLLHTIDELLPGEVGSVFEDKQEPATGGRTATNARTAAVTGHRSLCVLPR